LNAAAQEKPVPPMSTQPVTALESAAVPVCLGMTLGKPLLQLRLGHASAAVAGKVNEDFYGIVTPAEEPEAETRGIAVAVADGVSGNGEGRVASETTVKSLLRDFYGAPVTWDIPHSLDKLLRATNDWLLTTNSRHPHHEAAVSTLSMMLFRGNYYYMAHVGDTRVYRQRRDVFRQLTSDHTWQRSDMRHVLKRAVGLDSHLVVDYTDGELLPGDVFVLVSDGIWEVLGDKAMREALAESADVQAAAASLVERSIKNQVQYMGRNDATAIVVAVEPFSPAR
jgi:serine/threonine protein phosphatase PrpC